MRQALRLWMLASVVGVAAAAAASEAEVDSVSPLRKPAPDAEQRPSPATFDRPARHRTIEIVWFDPLDALPCRFEELVGEAEAVFRTADVAVRWRKAGPGTVTQPPQVHAVLLDGAQPAGQELVLGATGHSGAPALNLWISLPAIKRTLGLDPTPGRAVSAFERRQLARALARVLLHEVVHAVAPDLPHAATGLMCERMDRAFLLKESVAIDAAWVAALREAPRVKAAAR